MDETPQKVTSLYIEICQVFRLGYREGDLWGSFPNFSPFSPHLDNQTLLLKTVHGAQKAHPQECLFSAGSQEPHNQQLQCTRTSKLGASLPTDNSAAQVPPGGKMGNRKKDDHLLEETSK